VNVLNNFTYLIIAEQIYISVDLPINPQIFFQKQLSPINSENFLSLIILAFGVNVVKTTNVIHKWQEIFSSKETEENLQTIRKTIEICFPFKQRNIDNDNLYLFGCKLLKNFCKMLHQFWCNLHLKFV
jgi:hypothetical protein